MRLGAALVLGCWCLGLPSVFAQGTAFTYQGRLNQSGTPYTGNAEFQPSLWSLASGGAQVAANNPAIVVVAVTNGLFVLPLDFGANFPGADRWLQLEVRTTLAPFTLLSPRQKLTATPYAISASNLSGTLAASQLTGTISASQIGAGSITAVMLAAGAIGSNQLAAGAVTSSALADGAVTANKLVSASNWFALTITNPAPGNGDNFGGAVAAVGSDRLLIGAAADESGGVRAGAAHLFDLNGTWLTTFTNPTPADGDNFGFAVAALGSDRVIIGAYGDNTGAPAAGVAYLYSTSGALLTTFTNPTPASNEYFGWSVAPYHGDRVLVGARGANTSAPDAGAAYLFGTNGALLATFAKAVAVTGEQLGDSVAAVGASRVAVSADWFGLNVAAEGIVFVYSIDGVLRNVVTNPTPAEFEFFGASVAAVGSGHMLIGAPGDDTGAESAGAAYLYTTEGALITTFTNPAPGYGDFFGDVVAAMGSDRVLICAHLDDARGQNSGVAYLFGTNGVLLATFTSPAPSAGDIFGKSIAAVGTDRVLAGAYYDDLSAPQAGAAYLFSLDKFVPVLVAEAVSTRSVTTTSLENGAVTLDKLDPAIGVWSRAGDNVFRPAGNVGIGTSSPGASLHIYSTNNPTLVRVQSSGAPGLGRVEFWSDPQGDVYEWRPSYIQSMDLGGWTGGLGFYVNGTGFDNRTNAVEVMRLFHDRVTIGASNVATATRSFAAGYRARAIHAGSFVWADSQNADFASTLPDQFRVRAEGGVYLDLNEGHFVEFRRRGSLTLPSRLIHTSTGAYLSEGGLWVDSSDRTRKENFRDVHPATVLEKVVALPISTWNYKVESDNVRHIGPVAQDFHAAFGVGAGDRHIAALDGNGVALAAIQGLNQKLTEELQQKETQIAKLEERLGKLERLMNSLTHQLADTKGGAK